LRINISPKLGLLLLSAVTIVSICIATTFLLWEQRNRELEHARIETLSINRMLMEQTEQIFSSVDLLLLGVQERLNSDFGSRLALDSMPVQLLLAAKSSGMGNVSSVFLVDADGQVVNTSREKKVNANVSNREYFRAFSEGKMTGLFIGVPELSRVDDRLTLHLSRKLEDRNGGLRGVVAVSVKLDEFARLYDQARLDFIRPIGLYLDNGRLIATLPERSEEIGVENPAIKKAITSLSEGETRRIPGATKDDESYFLGNVRDFPLAIAVSEEAGQALAEWRQGAMPIVIVASAVCILIAIVTAMLIHHMERQALLRKALDDADRRYRGTVDSLLDAIIAVDTSLKITMFNPAAERMFGISAHQAIGMPMDRLLPERFRNEHQAHIGNFLAADEGQAHTFVPQIDILGLRADCTEFPIESTISKSIFNGQLQLTAVLRDVTERRRAEHRLSEMNQQLRTLSARLQEVREQERAHIARELHDEQGQQLTGLKLDLTWLANRLHEGKVVDLDKVDQMRHLLDATIASVRQMSVELRPLILDDLGLPEAIAWQCAELEKRAELVIDLDINLPENATDPAQSIALFRIVQESLTNIVRHSHAGYVEIALEVDHEKNEIVLTIQDDGEGISDTKQRNGIGLISMRERATELGGSIAIDSTPGRGVRIEVRLPLARPDGAGDSI
jgi:PAS domain S-box-containing protein